MEREKIKQVICEYVLQEQWIPGGKLAVFIFNLFSPSDILDLEYKDYDNLVEEMVKEGKLIELEYISPTNPDRIKSIYFPQGTKFNIGK